MKTLFTAENIFRGGRSGTIQTPDRLLNVSLGNPLEKGIEKRGPNPELLFAGAYSACYHGVLSNAAKKLGTLVKDSTVRALVSLIEDDQGGSAWRWNCKRSFLEPIAPRFNASWPKRTEPGHIPKLCAATIPPSCWWTNRQSQHEGRESTFAVTLAAN